MLGKIIQEEHRKINGTAKREKQTVDYIANLENLYQQHPNSQVD